MLTFGWNGFKLNNNYLQKTVTGKKQLSSIQWWLIFICLSVFPRQVHVLRVQWPAVERQHGQSSIHAVRSWGRARAGPGLAGWAGERGVLLSHRYLGGLNLCWHHETGTRAKTHPLLLTIWNTTHSQVPCVHIHNTSEQFLISLGQRLRGGLIVNFDHIPKECHTVISRNHDAKTSTSGIFYNLNTPLHL